MFGNWRDRWLSSSRSWQVLFLQVLIVGTTYYVSARLSLHLALVGSVVTPIWPPTGIALVAMLVCGIRVWPVVTLAALAVNIPINADIGSAALIAVGNTLAPLVAAWLLRSAGFSEELSRLRDALALVFLVVCRGFNL